MTGEPVKTTSSVPPATLPLTPSDIADELMPYGPPPPTLVEFEDTQAGLSPALAQRIRALATNATLVRDQSPETAAQCWHEAGRLLDQRAGRKAEAWLCHSRALVVCNGHKPALAALRRLARFSGDSALLERILRATIDASPPATEKAALWTEVAVTALGRGSAREALAAFREAEVAWPRARVPRLLKIGVAAQEKDDSEILDALDDLLTGWPEPTFSRELHLARALLLERLGRPDAALKALKEMAPSDTPSTAGEWAQLRLSIRIEAYQEALDSIDRLVLQLGDTQLTQALVRLKWAIHCIAFEHPPSDLGGNDPNTHLIWDWDTLGAGTEDDAARIASSARNLKDRVQSNALKGALETSALIADWKNRARPDAIDPTIDPDVRQALANFLRIEAPPPTVRSQDPSQPASLAYQIHAAITHQDWAALADALTLVRQKSAEALDRWAISVGEAGIRAHYLKCPQDALEMLRAEADRVDRPPLPAFTRAFETDPKHLAALAIAEAEDGDDDGFKAWRFAWAGHHIEATDAHEAGEIYLRSLGLMPTNRLALNGLVRTRSDPVVLAEAFQSAAEVAETGDARFYFLVRAGIQYLILGRGAKSAELLGRAFVIKPDDPVLRDVVVRLVRSHIETAQSEYVEPLQVEDAIDSTETLCSLGFLAMEILPSAGVFWFEKALEKNPDDPIVKFGHRESLLRSDGALRVIEEVRSALDTTTASRTRIAAYQQLVHLESNHGNDPAAVVSALEELSHLVPENRTVVTWLLVYALGSGTAASPLAARLAHLTSDPEVSIALARAARCSLPSDTDLLNLIVDKDPNAIFEMTELESLSADPVRKIDLLEKLVAAAHSIPVHLSRLAEAIGQTGDIDRAIALHQQVIDQYPAALIDLFSIAKHQRAAGDHTALVDTLVALVEALTIPEHKVQTLTEAIGLAHKELDDPKLLVKLCLDVLTVDPRHSVAYTLGREALDDQEANAQTTEEDRNRPSLLKAFISHRLTAEQSDDDRRVLHLELAHLLLQSGKKEERDQAKTHLKSALDIAPGDIETQQFIARLHREDEEWNDAIDHLTLAATHTQDRETGIDVFFSLGQIYMDHTPCDGLAEKSFLKVLGWHQFHSGALTRISDLYLKTGQYERAAQALQHIVNLTEDTEIKLAKMVLLAKIYITHLDRPKDGEKLLTQVRQINPLLFEPVAVLADLLRNEGDMMALGVHLDSALSSMAALLPDHLDNVDLYDNIRKILSLKGDDLSASFAVELIEMLGNVPEDVTQPLKRVTWDAGARIGDPAYEAFLCPKTISPGLRETMKATEGIIAGSMDISARNFGADRNRRLARRSPISTLANQMAPGFSLDPPVLYQSLDDSFRIVPGSPVDILLPQYVVKSEDAAVHRFAIGTGLQMMRLGLSLATLFPDEQLIRLLSGVVRVFVPGFVPSGMSDAEIEQATRRLSKAGLDRVTDQIRPFAFDCTDVLNRGSLVEQCLAVGYRAGFLSAGSLLGGLAGLSNLTSTLSGSLSDLPGAGALLAFVFSKDHLELRLRIGL
ncbi:MAG: hypothetical protein QNJ97_13130 [Myxococcota bacterium]|nr:hypothetical protein [Myxococcota bacterium]